jgi:voltage-gated potassium channel
MEEIFIPERSPFANRNLLEAGFRRDTGVIIVGIKKQNSTMVFNPDSNSVIEARDTLIVLGQSSAIAKMEHLVSSTREVPSMGEPGQGQASVAT